MARTQTSGSHARPTHATRALDLQCPECTQTVAVQASALVEAGTVRCPACGTTAELTHEFDEAQGRSRWILVDPLADYDDDTLPP